VAGVPVAIAAGLCPQATLEVELEQFLGVEVLGSGLEVALGQELGGGCPAAGAVVDRDGLPADGEGVLVVLGREGMQGVAAVAVQVAALR
jgi:hypothetical protein